MQVRAFERYIPLTPDAKGDGIPLFINWMLY